MEKKIFDRKAIKKRGKERFFATYWTALLTALVVTALVGGLSSFGSPVFRLNNLKNVFNVYDDCSDNSGFTKDDDGNYSISAGSGDDKVNISIGEDGVEISASDGSDQANISVNGSGVEINAKDKNDQASISIGEDGVKINAEDSADEKANITIDNDGMKIKTSDGEEINVSGDEDSVKIEKDGTTSYINPKAGIGVLAAFLIAVYVFVFLFVLAINVFLINPLYVGGMKFFINNLNQKESPKKLGAMFKSGLYGKTVLVMFLKNLFLFLWTLLLIVPGIIKSYEYRMIPYILADNPELSRQEIFAKSREMMRGYKWKCFVFDLSFIGWNILSALTLGFLGVFYVNPYKWQACAGIYEALLNKDRDNETYENYIEVQ